MAKTETWAALKVNTWGQLFNSYANLRGDIVTVWRRWESLHLIELQLVDKANLGITETSTLFQTSDLSATETVAVTEDVRFEVSRPRNDWVELLEDFNQTVGKNRTDSVAITEDINIVLSLGRELEDTIGVTETSTFDVSWVRTEPVTVSEILVKDVSRSPVDNVGISENVTVVLQMQEVHTEVVNLSEEVTIVVYDAGDDDFMSLVDDKRLEIKTLLGLTDAQVAGLTINDLLHRYWSFDFPLGHTYDGSESLLMPKHEHSILDHKVEVGVNLNWIRDVREA